MIDGSVDELGHDGAGTIRLEEKKSRDHSNSPGGILRHHDVRAPGNSVSS
jgi:hypothetical protein